MPRYFLLVGTQNRREPVWSHKAYQISPIRNAAVTENSPQSDTEQRLRDALIIVRARHVITADRANQLAAARNEPLRTNGTIPRDIVTGGQSLQRSVIADNLGWPGSERARGQ